MDGADPIWLRLAEIFRRSLEHELAGNGPTVEMELPGLKIWLDGMHVAFKYRDAKPQTWSRIGLLVIESVTEATNRLEHVTQREDPELRRLCWQLQGHLRAFEEQHFDV